MSRWLSCFSPVPVILLSVLLVASPFFSCYAWGDASYGDTGSNYERISENSEFRPGVGEVGTSQDFEGVLPGSEVSNENGEVEDGLFSVSSGSADFVLDQSSTHYLADSLDESSSDSVTSYLEDIVSLLGEIADYYRQGGSGISPLADINSVYDKLFALNANLGSYFGVSGGSSSASNRSTFTINGMTFSVGRYSVAWIFSYLWYNLDSVVVNTSRVNSNIGSLITLMKSQWGYGYGSTAVLSSNSPAGWLQKLRDYNVNEYYDGYTYSTAKYLAFIFREMERANAKLNYNGSLVGGAVDDYSASRLLARVHNALYGDVVYAETGNGGVRSAVSVLGYLANLTYYGNRDVNTLMYRNTYSGGLVGVSGSDTYGTARLLARVHNALYGELTYSETGGTGVRSTVGVLGYIANMTYDTQYTNGKYLETGTSGKRSISDVALYLANLVYDSSYSHGELLETGTSGKRSMADLIRYAANLVYLLKGDVSTLVEFARADSSFLPEGFSDVLSRLDLLHEDLGSGISVDTSGIESNLDKIAGLLLAAGVIENSKDLFDAVFGDLSGIGQAAAIGAIQSAMEDAFPFCVPALVKQVFGLLVFEGSAPVWEFDICGYPLVCDFAGFQLVADCTSWLSRLGLLLALLVNTRKFVFTVNGGGSS